MEGKSHLTRADWEWKEVGDSKWQEIMTQCCFRHYCNIFITLISSIFSCVYFILVCNHAAIGSHVRKPDYGTA